ncbi:MAG: peptide chain release factor 1 [Oscillospiraceae bacterium]|jgi:peptide chain release factor 1|nr:peptide chain release factor 1 [Oscillospiraceae bacterium]
MFERLKEYAERYSALEYKTTLPEIYGDADELKRVTKEMKEASPFAEAYAEILSARSDAAAAEELGDNEERASAIAKIAEIEARASELLNPRDPNDDKNVIMEIRGGAGGEESSLFARSLYRMYAMYSDSRKWKIELVNLNETELGGIKYAELVIEGRGAYSRLKFESGVHRVQRVPETESGGRIHTSTATVAVLPEVEDTDYEIKESDLRIDTFRASGAGGQHVNRTESAIRITHIPTGVVVECQDERSQYKNRDRAMKILRSRLVEAEREKQTAAIAAERKSQIGTGMRNERIRTYNFPQGRVTDHRIGLTLHKIDAVMDGGLDEIIDALRLADSAFEDDDR